jgi:hypothetical protein
MIIICMYVFVVCCISCVALKAFGNGVAYCYQGMNSDCFIVCLYLKNPCIHIEFDPTC